MADQTCSSIIDLHRLIKSIQLSISENPNQEGGSNNYSFSQHKDLIGELKRDADHIQRSLNKLKDFMEELGKRIQPLASRIDERRFEHEDLPRFLELTSAVTHFKFQLPFTPYFHFTPDDHWTESLAASENEYSPSTFDSSMAECYEQLAPAEKQCLSCFLVFPESEKIKKRVLINWWIGEGLLSDVDGEGMLERLHQKRLISPVLRKRRVSGSWWMEPVVRSFIKLKEEQDQECGWLSKRVILLKSQADDLPYTIREETRVETIFNVSSTRANVFEVDKLDALKCLRVLHLGRSTSSQPKQHIQVEGSVFLDGLRKTKNLQVLSLEGIPSLTKLPKSVFELENLKILDLRACQALESLSSKIWMIKTLTHLDLSECFTRQWLPKTISRLSNLKVLKGFVISHSDNRVPRRWRTCTLEDLRKLKKLHTLSVFVVRRSFPHHREDLKDLGSFEELVKLKIVWLSEQNESYRGEKSSCDGDLMMGKLEKLDLWRVPEEAAPLLLNPNQYPVLKKLYIRGSPKLQDINGDGADSEQKWRRVSTLRLIGLPCLKVREDLRSMFPELSYLEKSECPNLQFPDCNEEGVWTI